MTVPPLVDTAFIYVTASSIAVAISRLLIFYFLGRGAKPVKQGSAQGLWKLVKMVSLCDAIFGPIALQSEGRIADLLYPSLIAIVVLCPCFFLAARFLSQKKQQTVLQEK